LPPTFFSQIFLAKDVPMQAVFYAAGSVSPPPLFDVPFFPPLLSFRAIPSQLEVLFFHFGRVLDPAAGVDTPLRERFLFPS